MMRVERNLPPGWQVVSAHDYARTQVSIGKVALGIPAFHASWRCVPGVEKSSVLRIWRCAVNH
jgi:hypothetical protein